jgi:hypothetical protein
MRPLTPLDLKRLHAQSPRDNELYSTALEIFGSNDNDGSVKCFVLPSYYWEDAFDASNVKTLKNKVWCLLASLATPQECIHSSSNTYLLGLGPGTESHEEVYELLREDLDFLRKKDGNIFYFNLGKNRCPSLPRYTRTKPTDQQKLV